MSLYDKLSEKYYPIKRPVSKAGQMLAFARAMNQRVPHYRYPATRCRPTGLMQSKRYGSFRVYRQVR